MKLLASTIVRLSQKGASHGMLYEYDTTNKKSKEVFRWADENINWEGRGGDRGLRGIAFYKNLIIVGSGKQILFLNWNYELQDTFQHSLLGDIHELIVHKDDLIITSTLFDLIIYLNIPKKEITQGYFIKPNKINIKKQDIFHKKFKALKYRLFYWLNFNTNIEKEYTFKSINPKDYVPEPTSINKSIHINSVFVKNEVLCFTGTQKNIIFGIDNNQLKKIAIIPYGTHNVQPYKNGYYIANYTIREKVVITNSKGFIKKSFIINYDKTQIKSLNTNHAKPGWNRGLCIHKDILFIGSSPACINIIDLSNGSYELIKLDSDVRNSIHGLEVIPPNLE
ncbi:MAG: hypothetical protein ACOCUV_01210 [bacterium]